MALKKRRSPGRIIIFCLLLVLSLCWALPLIWAVWTTIRPASLATSFSFEPVFSTENIRHAFTAFDFLSHLKNSVIVTAIAVLVNFVIDTMAAYAIARVNFSGKKLVRVLLMAQLIIPGDVLLLSNYLTMSDMGLLNTHLAVVIIYFGSAMGVLLFVQAYRTVPAALEEASVIDGCNTMQTMLHVYTPCLKTAYLSFAIISVNFHWNNYLWPNVVINAANLRTLPIGLALMVKVSDTGPSWGYSTAATMLIMLPLFLLFARFQKQFINSFVTSGIK